MDHCQRTDNLTEDDSKDLKMDKLSGKEFKNTCFKESQKTEKIQRNFIGKYLQK
jgi:hypothetical protein